MYICMYVSARGRASVYMFRISYLVIFCKCMNERRIFLNGFVCLYVFLYVCLYVCMFVCMFVFMYVCMFVCLFVCLFGLSEY